MPQGGYPIPPAELVVGPFGGEWTEEHLDFDALISSVDFDKDIAVVVAYSRDSKKLREIRGNYRILGGLTTREVKCVD